MATLTKNCDGDLTKKIPCENKHIIDMTKMELNLPCQKWSKNLPWQKWVDFCHGKMGVVLSWK